MSNYLEIEVKEPCGDDFYDIEHKLNCYPLVWTSDNEYHGVNFDDNNHLYLSHMKGFTGKIILVQ